LSRSVVQAEESRTAAVHHEGFGDRAGDWLEDNSKLVNALLVVLILGFVGWYGYKWYRDSAVNKANAAYAGALEQYSSSFGQEDVEKKKDALNGAITAAQTVIQEHSGQHVAIHAQMLLANAYYRLAAIQAGEQGREAMKKSQDAFQKVINSAKSDTERAAGYIGLGNVLQDEMFISENKDMAKQVEDAYKQAMDAGKGTYLEAEAQMNHARLLEGTGRREDARKLYEEVAADRKVVPAKEKADVKPLELTAGQVITAEQVQGLKSFEKWSYAELAQEALKRLDAAGPAAPAAAAQ